VELAATESRVILSVRDHGPGIASEEHDRIFEPFERASRDPRVRGAGLGLWIVRRLVEAHGGSVCVMSAPGSGAQFVIELPRGATD
jgi:signal transduction histidine kinase